MLEAMAALILAIVGVILIMMILAYGIYSTFYPLGKTVQSGMAVAQAQVEEAAEKRLLGKKPYSARFNPL